MRERDLQISLLDPAQSQREAREGGGSQGAVSLRESGMEMLQIQEQTPSDFALFWADYPRKQAKKDAQKAWAKLKPSPELVDQMLEAIAEQKRGRQWKDGFVPLPATWLRGERWTDELDPKRDFYRAKL